MDESQSWYLNQVDELIDQSQDYKEKAILQEVKAVLKEQAKRREQNEGELDGRLWSPGGWGN